ATVATACSSLGLSTSGLSSVETVKAEAYIMMVWPSGSACSATYLAPTRPPAPSRFSTITGWPSVCVIFSARMRAMVSDAAPGVTPEMKRTVLLGNCCAWAATESASASTASADLISILLLFWQSELRGEPVRRAAAVAIGTVVGIVPAVLDDHQFDRPGDAARQALSLGGGHQAVLAPGHDEDRAFDLAGGI